MRRASSTTVVAGATLALLVVSSLTVMVPFGRAHAATNSISRVSSGLVASDSLTTGSTAQWTFGGDASSQPGAKYTHSEDSQGLHIAVQPATSGTWSGYYAVSRNTSATLFHAVVTLAYTSVPDNGFNTGIYVQTWNNDFIDYIGCLGVAVPLGHYWTVVQSYGVIVGSQVINTLYQSPLNAGPMTQDCTIITNGNNFLKVYLGGSVVVNKNNMTLNMPPPQQVYLEPQSSTASSLLTGTYTGYYATTKEGVTVTGAPVGGTAELVDASNNVLASAQAAANGSATMPVGKYSLPISGTIKVLDKSNTLVAATTTAVSVWGGDVYAASSSSTSTTSTSSTSSTTTTSTTTAGAPIALNNVASTSGVVSNPPFQITLSGFNAGTGSNRLLLVGVSANNNNVASVTFGGVALKQEAGSFYNNDAELWYLVNPSGAADIVVTMAGATSVVVGAYAFSGVNQANPIPTQVTAHNTSPGSPAISITTQYQNSWIVDLPSIYGGSTLGSPTCTQNWDINVANAITGASSSTAAASAGAKTCGWTASNGDFWDDVAIEIMAKG